MKRLARWYGANPLHLLALLGCFALAGYASAQLVKSHPLAVALWFLGAVVGHDLLLLPLYSLADRSAMAAIRHRSPRLPAVPWINYLRVPAGLSGLLLLIWFPLILRRGTQYHASTTLSPDPFLWHWLAVTGALFLLSAAMLALRFRRTPHPAAWPSTASRSGKNQHNPAGAPRPASPPATRRPPRTARQDADEPGARPPASGPPPVRARNHTIPDTRHSRPRIPSAPSSAPSARAPGRIMGYVNSPFRWWTGLSPRRRVLLGALALVVAVAAVVTGALASGGAPEAIPGRPGVVLLVPGYGGSATSLDELAARIRASGRTATVVALAGDGTGDLTVQARVLDGYVNRAIGAGSGPVTVIGYSAGGVVAWLWYVDYGGASRTGKIITLGSPLHGARIAAVGTGFDPAECPAACQQLAPGSALLTELQRSSQVRPPWLSLWSTDDQTVRPPDSAQLPGAVDVPLQSVCPGADIQHSQLPTAPLVVGLVLRALASNRLTAPPPGDCATLQSAGR